MPHRFNRADHGGTLTHHGIKGQHWGVRRGPPYPLDAEQKATRFPQTRNTGMIDRSALTTQQMVTTIASFLSQGKEGRFDKALKSLDQLPRQDGTMTRDEDMTRVNPKFDPLDQSNGYYTNCANCADVYELRRRGYDVEARAVSTEGVSAHESFQRWKGTKPESVISYDQEFYALLQKLEDQKGREPTMEEAQLAETNYLKNQRSAKQLRKTLYTRLSSQPEGSRGILSVLFLGNQAGHVMNYEIRRGKVYIIDAQCGKTLEFKDTAGGSIYPNGKGTPWKWLDGVYFYRTDNLEPNPKTIKYAIEPCKLRS